MINFVLQTANTIRDPSQINFFSWKWPRRKRFFPSTASKFQQNFILNHFHHSLKFWRSLSFAPTKDTQFLKRRDRSLERGNRTEKRRWTQKWANRRRIKWWNVASLNNHKYYYGKLKITTSFISIVLPVVFWNSIQHAKEITFVHHFFPFWFYYELTKYF